MAPAPTPVVEEEAEIQQTEPRPPGRPPNAPTISAPATAEVVSVYNSWVGRLSGEYRELPAAVDDIERDYGTDIYERMMWHPQVSSSVETRILTTLAHELTIQPGGAVEGEPGFDQARRYAEFCRDNLARLETPFHQILYVLDEGATVRGHKIAELVYEIATLRAEDGPQLVLKAIKPKPNDAYAQIVDEHNNLLGILPRGKYPARSVWGLRLADIKDDLVPRSKFLRRVNQPRDGNPNGTSDLRDAYFPWSQDVNLRGPYMQFLGTSATPSPKYRQREGGPPQWTYTDADGATVTVQAHVRGLEIAQGVHNGSGHFLPDGDDLEFMELATNGEVFDRAFGRFEGEIVKAITNQKLTTEEGEHQSRAAASVHQDIFALKPRYNKVMLAHMIKTQLFTPLLVYNFGEEALRYLPQADMGQNELWDMGTIGQVLAQMALAKEIYPSHERFVHTAIGLPAGTEQEYRARQEAWLRELEQVGQPQPAQQQGAA